jgi:hypothetical protein
MCAEDILPAHPTWPGRLTVRLSGITQKQETRTMETTIQKRIEIEGYGMLDGEFI